MYQNELSKDEFDTLMQESWRELVEDIRLGAFFVTAKKEEKVVGFAIFKKEEKEEGVMYLSQMAVAFGEQRTGIGKELVFSILNNPPEERGKIEKIVLVTRIKNEGACRFYEQIGFVEAPEYMHEGYDPARYKGYKFIVES